MLGRCRVVPAGRCGTAASAHPPAAWGEPARGRPCPLCPSRAAPPAPAAAAPLGSAERGVCGDTELPVAMGCLARPGVAASGNAVQGDTEPLSSRSTLRGEAAHPAAAQWQGHGLLYEQKAGFVFKCPSGAVSVGREQNSGRWCFSSDPRGAETIVRDQLALLCSRVTLRTPGRAQAYAVVLQTRLGLGGDIFDKVPTGKKDLTVRLYFPDYLAGFG